MKKRNLGFSLVELIVAFAIAAIAGLAAFQMLSFGNNSFKNTSKDVGLQYEQQIVVNQLRDYILESSNAIHYDALNKSLYVFKQDGKLATTSGDVIDVPYEISKIKFLEPNLGKSEGEEGYDANSVGYLSVNTQPFATIPDNYQEQLLADGIVFGKDVKNVTFDMSEVDKGRVSFDIVFFKEGKEYPSHQVVSLRNSIIDSDSLVEIYEERTEISSFMEGIDIYRDEILVGGTDSIKRPTSISNPEEFVLSAQYEARVSKKQYSEFDYIGGIKWELDTSSLSDVYKGNVYLVDDVEGKVKVAVKGEVSGTVQLTAISEQDTTIKKTVNINIENTGGLYPISASLPLTDPVRKLGVGSAEYTFTPKIEYNDFVELSDKTKNTKIREGKEALDYIEWHLVNEPVIVDGEPVKVKITYEDGTTGETDLSTAELLEEVTGGKYTLLNPIENGKISFSSLANGYTFHFYFTVKQRNAEGQVLQSNVIGIKVNIPSVSNNPLNISVNGVTMRDDFIAPSVLWKINPDSSNVKYYWKIIPTKTETSVQWYGTQYRETANFENRVKIYTKDKHIKGQGVETFKWDDFGNKFTLGNINEGIESWYNVNRTDNWYIGDLAGFGPVAYVDSYLDWNNEYAIKVLCFAVSYDSSGKAKTLYDSNGVTDVSNGQFEVTPLEETTTLRKVELKLNPINYISGNIDQLTLVHPGDATAEKQSQRNEKRVNYQFKQTESKNVFVRYREREYEYATEIDEDGNVVFKRDSENNFVYKTDSNGKKVPKKDTSGNIIYIQNEFGENSYVKDKNGNEVYEDKQGYPVYINISGSPKYIDELGKEVLESDIKVEWKTIPVEYSTDTILKPDRYYESSSQNSSDHDVEIRFFRLTAQGLHLSFNDTQSVINGISGKHTIENDDLNRSVDFVYDLRAASNSNDTISSGYKPTTIGETAWNKKKASYYNSYGIVGFAYWIIPDRSPFSTSYPTTMDYQMLMHQELEYKNEKGITVKVPFDAKTQKITYEFDIDYVQK